jgi:hypothetical protein
LALVELRTQQAAVLVFLLLASLAAAEAAAAASGNQVVLAAEPALAVAPIAPLLVVLEHLLKVLEVETV